MYNNVDVDSVKQDAPIRVDTFHPWNLHTSANFPLLYYQHQHRHSAFSFLTSLASLTPSTTS